MKFSNRRIHYWVSIGSALPVLVMIATGLLLHLKKDFAWIQPPELKGRGGRPAASMDRILEACLAVPEAGVKGWEDIRRIDLRPAKGMMKVTTGTDWEIQLDAGTAAVLQAAYRRSDIIEALHDGSWFHPAVKRWVFLPAGAALLALWVTGLYLFIQPLYARRRRSESGP